jgi:hypothetical protein
MSPAIVVDPVRADMPLSAHRRAFPGELRRAISHREWQITTRNRRVSAYASLTSCMLHW